MESPTVKRATLISAAIVLGFGVAIILIVVPLWTSTKTVKNDIAIAERSLELRSRRRVTAEDEQRFKQLQTQSDRLGTLFIKTSNDVGFLERLEALADTAGVTVKIQFIKEPVSGKRMRVPLQLTIDGECSKISKFLGSLTNEPYLMTFTALTVGGRVAETSQLEATLTTETLWE